MRSPSGTGQQGPVSLSEMTWGRTNRPLTQHFLPDDMNILHQVHYSMIFKTPCQANNLK